jgi:hypothetical protein
MGENAIMSMMGELLKVYSLGIYIVYRLHY